jgi:uncharacterized sodium:solute symporter family permease YidK
MPSLFSVWDYGYPVQKEKEKTTEDYFLASKSLPWWAIGASLIAANISAEQFIGMSGSGFAVGLAIASYEWMAAITLIIVGKYFLPIFIKQGLYTIPEFIEKRFNTSLKTILAVFWIALFVFVNLTSVLYLGAKALDTILGVGDGSKIIPFYDRISIICRCLFDLGWIIGRSMDRCNTGCIVSCWGINNDHYCFTKCNSRGVAFFSVSRTFMMSLRISFK